MCCRWLIVANSRVSVCVDFLWCLFKGAAYAALSRCCENKFQDVAKKVSAGGGKEAVMIEIGKGKLE